MAVIVGILASACGFDAGTATSIANGAVEMSVVSVSEKPFLLHDVVASDDVVVALVSKEWDRNATVLLRSDDGGTSWTVRDLTIGSGLRGPPFPYWDTAAHVALGVAGSSIVATRTVAIAPESEFARQGIAVSPDLGATWKEIDLPAPPGMVAIVNAVAALNGDVILAGAVQALPPPQTGPFPPGSNERRAAYDAAVWRLQASGGVERLGTEVFDNQPDAQLIRYLEVVDDRLIALGGDARNGEMTDGFLAPAPGVWSGTYGGRSWSVISGLPGASPGILQPPLRLGDVLTTYLNGRTFSLEGGSEEWSPEVLPKDQWPNAKSLELGDGRRVLTWMEDEGCDCSVAMAGQADEQRVTSESRLKFEDCDDRSVRGETGVGAPVAVGGTVVALAYCNNTGAYSAAIAWTADDGARWKTTRLSGLADEVGADDIHMPYRGPSLPMVETSRGMLALLAASDGGGRNDDGGEASPIVALQLRPAEA